MNTEYKNLEVKVNDTMKSTISDVLEKLKSNSQKEKKEGVNLLDITKKLSAKKFGVKK